MSLAAPPSEFVSVAQFARTLGKSPNSVVRLIHSGQLVAYRIGRTYRISQRDIDAYLGRVCVYRAEKDREDPLVTRHRHAAAERRCRRAGL